MKPNIFYISALSRPEKTQPLFSWLSQPELARLASCRRYKALVESLRTVEINQAKRGKDSLAEGGAYANIQKPSFSPPLSRRDLGSRWPWASTG